MKLRIPELKFPNTWLSVWWAVAMIASLFIFFLLPEENARQCSCHIRHLPEFYLICAIVASYFIAVQIYIIRLAVFERLTSIPLIEKWRTVMAESQFLHLSLVPFLLLLPMIYYDSTFEGLNNNLIEMLIAPGTYSFPVPHIYTPVAKIGYFAFGTAIAYLHVRLLAAWLSLFGLIFRLIDTAKILVIILAIIVLIEYTNNAFIEPLIREGWGSCGYLEQLSSDSSEECRVYLNYRNINRLAESFEYSVYGTLTGGIQFINIFKAPLMRDWYDGLSPIDLVRFIINWELVRNLVAGILSPCLQLFFIMRYLKKRSFEKAKRG
jgi:hypothetical protein